MCGWEVWFRHWSLELHLVRRGDVLCHCFNDMCLRLWHLFHRCYLLELPCWDFFVLNWRKCMRELFFRVYFVLCGPERMHGMPCWFVPAELRPKLMHELSGGLLPVKRWAVFVLELLLWHILCDDRPHIRDSMPRWLLLLRRNGGHWKLWNQHVLTVVGERVLVLQRWHICHLRWVFFMQRRLLLKHWGYRMH